MARTFKAPLGCCSAPIKRSENVSKRERERQINRCNCLLILVRPLIAGHPSRTWCAQNRQSTRPLWNVYSTRGLLSRPRPWLRKGPLRVNPCPYVYFCPRPLYLKGGHFLLLFFSMGRPNRTGGSFGLFGRRRNRLAIDQSRLPAWLPSLFLSLWVAVLHWWPGPLAGRPLSAAVDDNNCVSLYNPTHRSWPAIEKSGQTLHRQTLHVTSRSGSHADWLSTRKWTQPSTLHPTKWDNF